MIVEYGQFRISGSLELSHMADQIIEKRSASSAVSEAGEVAVLIHGHYNEKEINLSVTWGEQGSGTEACVVEFTLDARVLRTTGEPPWDPVFRNPIIPAGKYSVIIDDQLPAKFTIHFRSLNHAG